MHIWKTTSRVLFVTGLVTCLGSACTRQNIVPPRTALKTYYDQANQFSLSYPALWQIDLSQKDCCITLLQRDSFVTLYNETDYTRAHNIHSLQGLVSSERLANKRQVQHA